MGDVGVVVVDSGDCEGGKDRTKVKKAVDIVDDVDSGDIREGGGVNGEDEVDGADSVDNVECETWR